MPPRRRAPRVRTPAAEAPADPEVEVDIEEPHGGQQAAQEVPVPPAAAPTMKAPSSKKQKHLKVKGIAHWTDVETEVRCAHTNSSLPSLFLPIARSLTQASAVAYCAANERHQTSTAEYRHASANVEYALQIKRICGDKGDGGEGKVPFPVKQRPPAKGGKWDMEASIQKRAQAAGGGSIYEHSSEVVKFACNRYNPLRNALLVNGNLPSGWSNSDLFHAMLYNMKGRTEDGVQEADTTDSSTTRAARTEQWFLGLVSAF